MILSGRRLVALILDLLATLLFVIAALIANRTIGSGNAVELTDFGLAALALGVGLGLLP